MAKYDEYRKCLCCKKSFLAYNDLELNICTVCLVKLKKINIKWLLPIVILTLFCSLPLGIVNTILLLVILHLKKHYKLGACVNLVYGVGALAVLGLVFKIFKLGMWLVETFM